MEASRKEETPPLNGKETSPDLSIIGHLRDKRIRRREE